MRLIYFIYLSQETTAGRTPCQRDRSHTSVVAYGSSSLDTKQIAVDVYKKLAKINAAREPER